MLPLIQLGTVALVSPELAWGVLIGAGLITLPLLVQGLIDIREYETNRPHNRN